MKVLGYNRSPKNTSFIKQTDLDTVIKQSDILIITAPYNVDSDGMIDKNKIQLLKK